MLKQREYQQLLHEIKNLVCVINGSVQLMEKEHPELSSYNHWNTITAELSILCKMFDEISSCRLLQSFQPTAISVNDFLQNLLHSTDSIFQEGISIHLDLEPNLPPTQADTTLLHLAVLNLLKNASEAMNLLGTIHLKTFCYDNHVVLSITDSGCGISESYMKQIYEPFFTTKSTGTGIGLPITKKIIDLHNGKLLCSSTLEKETTFSIHLPIHHN